MELHNILSSDLYDIVLVTETWLKDKYLNGEIVGSNSNYSVAARMDRSEKIGGGTLAIVKNKHSFLQIQLKNKYKNLELACFDLIGEDNKIRFIVCYRPPSFDQEAKTMLKLTLECLEDLFEIDASVVLVGDWNFPDIDWADVEDRFFLRIQMTIMTRIQVVRHCFWILYNVHCCISL